MKKWILWGLGAAALVFVLAMGVWMVVQGPRTVLRVVIHGDTTIQDFTLYPSRPVAAGSGAAPLESVTTLSTVASGPFGRVELQAVLEATDTISLIVVHGERIVFEGYGRGHGAGQISQIFSASKSVLSILIGAAIEDGFIGSVEDPVTRYVPELSQNGFDSVRIEDLLHMRSNADYVENDNPFGEHVRFNYTPNLEREILALTVRSEADPGFVYKSSDNALLGLILSRALGDMSIATYTQDRLWQPLGMQDDALWSLDDDDGLERTWCCFSASARDLVRLGMLYRDGGRWRGTEIIPGDWVTASTQEGGYLADAWSGARFAGGFWNYGYQWWLIDPDRGNFTARGKDGQFIYVDPEMDVVIVRQGFSFGSYGGDGITPPDWISFFEALAETATRD